MSGKLHLQFDELTGLGQLGLRVARAELIAHRGQRTVKYRACLGGLTGAAQRGEVDGAEQGARVRLAADLAGDARRRPRLLDGRAAAAGDRLGCPAVDGQAADDS
jgi:hypothetical protein